MFFSVGIRNGILDLSADTDTEAVYEFVEDDKELEAVSDVFEKLLDGVDFEIGE